MDILSSDKKSDNELEFELFEDENPDDPSLDINKNPSEQKLDNEPEWELSKDEYPIIWYEPDIQSDEEKFIQEKSSPHLFTEFTEALQFAENLGTGFLLITSNEVDEEKLLKDFGALRETYGRRYFDFEEEAVLASLFKETSKERMKSLKVYVFFTREEFFNEVPVHEKEEEVMIMRDVKEMAKQFQEEFKIFWCDPNLSAQERKETLFEHFDIQEENLSGDFESLLEELENSNGPPYHLILLGGQISTETIVNRIENLKDLIGLYIYESPPLVINWKTPEKVKIEKSLEGLIPKITEGIRTNSKLKNTFPAFATQFDDWDKSHINKVYYYLRGFINFKNRKQAKRDFIKLGKKVYQSQKLFQFEKDYGEYQKDKILKWYTADSPIFKLINNCLRISTSDSILYCRFALKDLERAIREEYQQQRYNGVVYRGAYMSKAEFEKLEKNIGKEIEMYGFLSTSKNLNIALRFLDSDTENKVLITLIIPPFLLPELDEQGFADVSKFSGFSKEEEILFNVRSRFQVVKIGRTQNQKGTECRHLVLLYGAQLLRKYMTIESPIISLKLELPLELKCNYCESKEDLFVMTGGARMVCRECLIHGKNSVSKSSLLLPIDEMMKVSEEKMINIEVRGKMLEFGKEAKLAYERIYQCNDCLESGKERLYKWMNLENENMVVECLECFRKNKESKLGCMLLQEEDMQMFWNKKQEKWEKIDLELKTEELEELKKCDGADIFRIVQDNQKCRGFCKLTLQKLARKAKREKGKIAKYVDLAKSSNHLGDKEKALECNLKALDIRKSIYGEQDSETAASYGNLASMYESLGDSNKALEYNLKSLDIIKSIHGETDPKTATSYNNIALVYTTLGNYQKALEYNLKALEIRESTYGETHPNTGTSYNNVALVYKDLGDYQKALECNLKALDITRSIYGETYPDTAASYNNLASVHENLGEHQKAIEYQLKALEIIKSIYGETYLRTATSYNNLASMYKNLGDHQKALESSLRAMTVTKALYEETHPETATSYNNLASAYQDLGEYQKALEYFLKALDLRKSIYGDMHPQTAASYVNIASLYDTLGNYQKALEYTIKSLDLTKSIYGETHFNTATSYNNLAMVYSNSREFQKALEFHLKALDIRKSIGGEKHPQTAISYNNLAPAYQGLGENKKALECLLAALDIFKYVYGETHPQVATSYNNIGVVYQKLGEFQKALEYNMKGLDLTKSIYGETHPEIAISYNNLAIVYSSLRDLRKALEFNLKAMNIYRTVFGEIHPHMAASYMNLSFLYFSLKDHQKAIEYNLKALDITKSIYGEIHPQTLNSYQNLAAMFQNLGYYLKAQEFHMKALEVNKSICEQRKKDSGK